MGVYGVLFFLFFLYFFQLFISSFFTEGEYWHDKHKISVCQMFGKKNTKPVFFKKALTNFTLV